tara:strand:+ start:296 stop:973 length:678 start_codon:yes stop_codon:yes gene_type:complete
MSNINLFELDQYSDNRQRLNIDSLYEQKRQRDMDEMRLFNRILSRVQTKIKTASLQKKDNQWCWCTIPHMIIGASYYDQASCVAYVQHHLQDNGFLVKYYHPDTLLIAWHHWVPSYTRNEIKKRYGVTLNERGEQVEKAQESTDMNGNSRFFSVRRDNAETDHILFKNNNNNMIPKTTPIQTKKSVTFKNPTVTSSSPPPPPSNNHTPYVSISSYKPPENILDQI